MVMKFIINMFKKKVNKLKTNVDMNYFGKRVTIGEKLPVGDSDKRYVYQVSHAGVEYIVKGYRILLCNILPGNNESVENFKESFEEINSIYQEYFFGRFVGDFNPHFVKSLLLDYAIQAASREGANSYMYIEVLFEHGGISLDNLDSISIEMVYNLMRQSAKALSLLHKIQIVHLDIKPANIVYDEEKDMLKFIRFWWCGQEGDHCNYGESFR
eukprot:TRINITY_DN2454_c0_g7_i2.p1 TRINITY_DN2454_c0_g7~~TRINITY_DN2454_c0_g7_i2.p1  ORF type:complete len:213 (+),score=53.77 TRINITY_DN2454_c0_g7_i2:147-785(+)